MFDFVLIVLKMFFSLYKILLIFVFVFSFMMILVVFFWMDLWIVCVIVVFEYLFLYKYLILYFYRLKVVFFFLFLEKLGSFGVWYVFGDLFCVDVLVVVLLDFGFVFVEKLSNYFWNFFLDCRLGLIFIFVNFFVMVLSFLFLNLFVSGIFN